MQFAAKVRSAGSRMESIIIELSNSGLTIRRKRIERSPFAGAGMRELNMWKQSKNGERLYFEYSRSPMLFPCVYQFVEYDFLRPIADIIHPAHPFHLVGRF